MGILTRNTVTKYSILAGEEFGVTVRWLGKNTRSAYLLYICGSRAIRAMVLAASSLCWLTSWNFFLKKGKMVNPPPQKKKKKKKKKINPPPPKKKKKKKKKKS